MLGPRPAGGSEARVGRLVLKPPGPVGASVLPAEDDERARAESGGSGIRNAVLRRFGASVRQTHRRAHVVVVDVPPDRQSALADALAAIGISARPPHLVQPLLNESVPASRVPPIWDAGFRGA